MVRKKTEISLGTAYHPHAIRSTTTRARRSQNHYQAFNIAKSVTRYSIGLSKKDETGKLIDRFLEPRNRTHLREHFDYIDSDTSSLSGSFDIYGVLSFVFIRQHSKLHANINLRDRKLASLRTAAEKYIKLIPDMVRQDGTGWAYGRSIGAYGQTASAYSYKRCEMADSKQQADLYQDTVKKLFLNFFITSSIKSTVTSSSATTNAIPPQIIKAKKF